MHTNQDQQKFPLPPVHVRIGGDESPNPFENTSKVHRINGILGQWDGTERRKERKRRSRRLNFG